jgi:hypothetical protein
MVINEGTVRFVCNGNSYIAGFVAYTLEVEFKVCYKLFVFPIVNHFWPFQDTAISQIALFIFVIDT